MGDPTQEELSLRRRALEERASAQRNQPAGPATRALVHYLRPVVQVQVGRVLLAFGRGRELDNLRASVEDRIQDVMHHLFADDWRYLRRWDPAKGRSLRSWVALLAERRTRDGLRRQVIELGAQGVMPDQALPADRSGEQRVMTAQLWRTARSRVLDELTSDGRVMFGLLFDKDLSTSEIMARTGKAAGAIFKRRHELRRRIRAQLEVLLSEGDG